MNSALNPSDTSTWLPLDELAPGFDANKAPHSTALAGKVVAVTGHSGSRLRFSFTADSVDWQLRAPDHSALPSIEGKDRYEAFDVDEGLFFVQLHASGTAHLAMSIVLDEAHGRALFIMQGIGELLPGSTAVRQHFEPCTIDGAASAGEALAPTTTLLGRRVMWEYSPVHAYEHVYLSPQWYSWQCLAGPERGLADTDENSVFQIRPGIYVFAWREKVIPCASVTIADHRDINAIRSHGVLFGLDESGTIPTHFTFGAFGRLLSTTVHPPEFAPQNEVPAKRAS